VTPAADAQPGEPRPADGAGPGGLLRYRSGQGRWVVAAMILGSSVAGIDSTVVVVALPAIGRDLHVGFQGLQWIVTSYTLTLASLILLAGSLSDRWGRRRVFLTGLSWFTVASAVGWGCLIAAADVVGMSRLTTATPFAWAAVCYVLVGVGFALMVPAGSAAAMASVPEGSSGIGSGLFNACRQIGTTMGLAILGSIGASVILADWHQQSGSFPPAERQSAAQAGADVTGGQVHAVAAFVGRLALDPAESSFLRGFGIALLLAGATLAVAGLVGFLGLRHLASPSPRQRQATDARTRRLTGCPVACRSDRTASTSSVRHRPATSG
jgi:MFS family permease